MTAVSVIIPAFRAEATLAQALDSVRQQSLADFEAVIIDDGSDDGTLRIARGFADRDPRFRVIALDRNGGVGAARNRGLAEARGTWIAFLDADDAFLPQRLETLLAEAETLHADCVVDNLQLFDHAVQKVTSTTCFAGATARLALTPELLFAQDSPFVDDALGYARPFVRRAFLQRTGLRYDEGLRLGEDFLFLSEILLSGAEAYLVPCATYVYQTRLSASTGAVSPHSRSGTRYADILRASDFLLDRYAGRLSPAARRVLRQRRQIFADLEALRQLRSKRLPHSLVAFGRTPRLLFVAARILARAARLRYRKGRQRHD